MAKCSFLSQYFQNWPKKRVYKIFKVIILNIFSFSHFLFAYDIKIDDIFKKSKIIMQIYRFFLVSFSILS
jgi:hypothetical protein